MNWMQCPDWLCIDPDILLMNFNLRFEGGGVFLIILPLLFALTHYIYKRTHPDVVSSRRWLLIVLRSAAFALIVALLVEPVLDLWNKRVQTPRLLVLVDTSHSMGVSEAGLTRLKKVQNVFQQPEWREKMSRFDTSVWGFSRELYAIDVDTLENIQLGGQATDLGAAIEEGLQKGVGGDVFQGILLFTDGAHNLGRSPVKTASEADIPVYSLAVGGGDLAADVQIVGARAIEPGYAGKQLTIEMELQTKGYKGRTAEVVLYEGEREIERRALVLQEGLQRLEFKTVPQDVGPHVYRLAVLPLSGEFTRGNNERLIFARIVEERPSIFIVAGRPSSDLSFLRRSLEADSSLSVKTWVQKDGSQLYNSAWDPSALSRGDVLVLLDYEADVWSGGRGEKLRQLVGEGMGLLFVGGAGGRRRGGDQDITELLPVELSPLSFIEEETLLRIGTQGENHPVVRLPMGAEGGDPWRQLPPLLGVYLVSSLHEGARVLVEDQQGNPLIVTGGYGRGKVVAALAHSFWRLDLVSSGVGGKPQTIRQFWRDAVRWLATSAPVGRVRASTEQHVYQAGLPVVFAVQVFDELLRPQEGATLRLWVNDNEVFQLQDRGGGYYRGVYSGLGPGEYIYKVVAELNEEQIGQDEGRFIVEKHSIEWSDMRGNRMLLGELAQASGGATFALEAWPELLNKWSLRQRLVEEILELRLWGRVWPLVLLVLLLAAEWILRKRCGMI